MDGPRHITWCPRPTPPSSNVGALEVLPCASAQVRSRVLSGLSQPHLETGPAPATVAAFGVKVVPQAVPQVPGSDEQFCLPAQLSPLRPLVKSSSNHNARTRIPRVVLSHANAHFASSRYITRGSHSSPPSPSPHLTQPPHHTSLHNRHHEDHFQSMLGSCPACSSS